MNRLYAFISLLVFSVAPLVLGDPPSTGEAPRNLLASTADFNGTAWMGFSRNAKVTNNVEAAPDGTQTAAHLVFNNGGYFGQIIRKAIPDHTYVFSTWMKSTTDQNISLAGENNNPAQVANFVKCAVTTEWQRFSVALKCPQEGNFNFRFSYRGSDIFIWHPQVEDVTGQPSEQPTDYVAVGSPSLPVVPQIQATTASKALRTGPQNIACWGDSLTQGAGGKPFTSFLQENYAGRTVFNGGIGGEKSPQIKSRFMAGQDKWGDVTVIWAGRNNYENVPEIEADIVAMVSQLQTKRFLVLSVMNMNKEIKDSSANKVINKLNSDLAKMFPSNFLDIRSALVAAYDRNIPQDVEDNKNDVPPSSLRSDGIHLNTAGYQFVAKQIADFFKSKNWLTDSDKGE